MNYLTRNKKIALPLVALILLTLASCRGSSVKGTYSNEMGTVLDLRSGGEASMTYLGMVSEKSGKEACVYTVKDKTIHLTCGDLILDFDIHDDGSLTGNPMFGVLRKSKS
jgi:hypothetical protein